MRSFRSPEQFFAKMKKKPAVQAVIDDIDNYSIEDIENLKGNQFPKWVRKVLVKYKNRGGLTAEQTALKIANEMTAKQLED